MITGAEEAVLAFLEAKLTADAALSGILYEARLATSVVPVKADRHLVVVRSQGATHPQSHLADVKVEIILGTPADVASLTIAEHKSLQEAIGRAWDEDDAADVAALTAQIDAVSDDWTGGGFVSEGWVTNREDASFNPVFTLLVGMVKV